MILESVIENLEAEGLLQNVPRTHVVLAFSGGADSTALLHLLTDIRRQRPLDVTAAYYNHRWRGSMPEELPLLHKQCLETETPLVIIQADLTIPRTESAARQARYRQLTRLARNLHADAVLTAHHADDQIETLLFRMLRGTGIDGLIGIQRRLVLEGENDSPVPILRPLLDVSRKTVREYIQQKQLAYFNDPTNNNLKIQRNNIRTQILPMLEESFPQVKNALFRLSLVAEGDLRIIAETLEGVWKEVHGTDKQGAWLNAVRFNQLGLPYQRRVLKRFLGEQDIHADFQTIEELLLFIRGEGRKNMDASLRSLIKSENGRTRFLSLYKDRLRLIEEPGEPQRKEPTPVPLPGEVFIPEMDIRFKSLPWAQPEKVSISPIRPNDNRQVFVNLSAYADKPLELRTRKPGDKFQPLGMDVPIRFKKFLINRGVPRFERDRLLVLTHGNQILWAPGLGISQELRIRDKDKPTHLLKMEPSDLHSLDPIVPIERNFIRPDADGSEDIRANALDSDALDADVLEADAINDVEDTGAPAP